MFKETAVEKLIEYIQALPEKEQKIIAQKISVSKKVAKKPKEKTEKEKIQQFIKHIKRTPTRLPKGYKFDREEANER